MNDGICDCCGGEDEWDSEVVCRDRCDEVVAEEKSHATLALAGSRAREGYVKKAATLRGLQKYSGVDGGPGDVFLAAAEEGCLKLDDGDYTYTVCLFDHVTQQGIGGGRKFQLGKKGEWSTSLWEDGQQRKDYSVLIMGDGEHCHASGAPRRAELHFECNPTPAVVSVQETQVCVYTFRVQSPAACHPLVHDDGGH